MAAASNTTGFLGEKVRANLEDVILLLDSNLKTVTFAGAIGGIAYTAFNWSNVAAAFGRVIRGKPQRGDEELASRALRAGGDPVQKAVDEAGKALQKVHEVGAGNRLEEIVKMAEKK